MRCACACVPYSVNSRTGRRRTPGTTSAYQEVYARYTRTHARRRSLQCVCAMYGVLVVFFLQCLHTLLIRIKSCIESETTCTMVCNRCPSVRTAYCVRGRRRTPYGPWCGVGNFLGPADQFTCAASLCVVRPGGQVVGRWSRGTDAVHTTSCKYTSSVCSYTARRTSSRSCARRSVGRPRPAPALRAPLYAGRCCASRGAVHDAARTWRVDAGTQLI